MTYTNYCLNDYSLIKMQSKVVSFSLLLRKCPIKDLYYAATMVIYICHSDNGWIVLSIFKLQVISIKKGSHDAWHRFKSLSEQKPSLVFTKWHDLCLPYTYHASRLVTRLCLTWVTKAN